MAAGRDLANMNSMLKRHIGLLPAITVVLVLGGLASALAGGWQDETAHQLMQRLTSPLFETLPDCDDPRFDLQQAMRRFYSHRHFEPAWVDRYGVLPEGAMALAAIKQAGRQGLRYADYHDPLLDDLLDGIVTRPVIIGPAFQGRQVQLDLVVTGMILRYAWHRTMGRIDPAMAHSAETVAPKRSRDLAVGLAQALDDGRLAVFLERLGPRHSAYRTLQRSLTDHLRIRAAGGWPTVDGGPKLKRGDCGLRVHQLRARLAASGDLAAAAVSRGNCFDEGLARAVARFQHRHGLYDDGVVGVRTLAALNVPVEARVRQIQLNMERWRWLPADLGARYLLVNIPGFEMQVIQAGQAVRIMRTIVGKKKRPTPVLSSRITYLEINPYWHVPAKIAREDLLPKIQANPSYLVRQNFRVYDSWSRDARAIDPLSVNWDVMSEEYFPVRLRQEPAGQNALGRVKFMFPNDRSVYIHDTPSKRLFKRASRPFSSGCVRVENPLELVSLLLDDPEWDAARLSEAVASNERQVVILDDPIPVHLVYLTAWVADDGRTHFGDDIYGHDQTLLSALMATDAARSACRIAAAPPTYIGKFEKER